jgi:hypothetical protein
MTIDTIIKKYRDLNLELSVEIEGMEPSRERLFMISLYELIEDELATIEQEMKNETSN